MNVHVVNFVLAYVKRKSKPFSIRSVVVLLTVRTLYMQGRL